MLQIQYTMINSNQLYIKNNVLDTFFFFKFSKPVCNGSFGASMKGINVSKDAADQFFVPKYGTVPEPSRRHQYKLV